MMKLIVIILLSVCFGLNSCDNIRKAKNSSAESNQQYQVNVMTTKTEANCNGAKPNDEANNVRSKNQILSNAKVYVRKGEFNDYETEATSSFTTNIDGKAIINLPEGKYVFVFEHKSNNEAFNELVKNAENDSNFDEVNEDCLDRYFKRPDGKIEISGDKEYNLELNRHFKCDWDKIPCARYKGKLPPTRKKR